MIKKWFVIFFIKCNIAALHWRWSTFTIYHINCESVTSKTTFRDQNEEAKDVHPRAHEWTRRWHEMGQWQRELKWVLACDWWRHNTGRGQELTHSPFTFSLHSRGERKRLIHTHTLTHGHSKTSGTVFASESLKVHYLSFRDPNTISKSSPASKDSSSVDLWSRNNRR